MAEARHCAGKGALKFALKLFYSYHLRNQSRHGRSALRVSSLSAGFLLDDIRNCRQNGVESAANRMLDFQDTKQRLETGLEKENDTESYCGVTECFCSSRLRMQLTNRKASRYQSCNKFRRTLSNCFRGSQSCQHFSYRGFGTRSESLHRTKTGYYDVLGVSPTATQAQIKTAYYKQSFLFHPDRNAGSEEATGRFSEISEAYAVLGNKGLRKKYDRGLLSPSDLIAPGRPSAKDTGASAKPHTERRSASSVDHRVFDFDKFYKSHYSEQLQREKLTRARREAMLRMKQDSTRNKLPDSVMGIYAGVLMIFGMGILFTLKQG